MERLEWQPEVEPYKNYCFTCGHFTEIDDKTKSCEPCIEEWIQKVRVIGSTVL